MLRAARGADEVIQSGLWGVELPPLSCSAADGKSNALVCGKMPALDCPFAFQTTFISWLCLRGFAIHAHFADRLVLGVSLMAWTVTVFCNKHFSERQASLQVLLHLGLPAAARHHGSRILLKRAANLPDASASEVPQQLEHHGPVRRLLQAGGITGLSLRPVSQLTGIDALEVPAGQSLDSWLAALKQHPGEVRLPFGMAGGTGTRSSACVARPALF